MKAISAELFFFTKRRSQPHKKFTFWRSRKTEGFLRPKEKLNEQKGISAVIATIMLLMISVSLIAIFYVFSSTLVSTTTGSGSQQTSQLTSQLSFCMQIDNIYESQISLRNCGKGVIDKNSLVVFLDDTKAVISADTIQENSVGTVNVTIPRAWNMSQTNPNKKYSLKISNGATTAQALVELAQRKSNLAGYWSFDEGSGNKANDGSGNGNIGTILPAGSEPTWVSGKSGNALQFDGVNDYVDAGNGASLNFNGAITIEAWIKRSNNNAGIISKLGGNSGLCTGSGYRIDILSGNTVRADFMNGCGLWLHQSISTILSGQFTHIAVVNNITNSFLYINGVLDTSGVTISPAGNNVPLTIGGPGVGGWTPNYFSGTIDEVRIWNKALTPDETVRMKQII